MIEERSELTNEQALSMLPENEFIHTFRGSGMAMVGCSHEREYIIDLIEKHGAELSGPVATSTGHGIALLDEHGWLFIEVSDDC